MIDIFYHHINNHVHDHVHDDDLDPNHEHAVINFFLNNCVNIYLCLKFEVNPIIGSIIN